jgi:hypothetical protein
MFPRRGGGVWYDDQRRVHQQIFAGDDELDYVFMALIRPQRTMCGSVRPPSNRTH